MHSRSVAIGIAFLCSSILSYAQQGLIGTYEGPYFEVTNGEWPRRHSTTLHITSAENGKLAGKFHVSGPSCQGDYVIDGTYQDNKLELRTSEGGVPGCGNRKFILNIESDKLVGKYDTLTITLSKK
jgi:hypothetical protein